MPWIHAVFSFFIVLILFVRDFARFLDWLFLGILTGVMIDADHLVWVSFLNPRELKENFLKLDLHGIWVLLNTEGSLRSLPYSKEIKVLIYLALHGSSMIIVNFFALRLPVNDILPIQAVLLGHYLLDLINSWLYYVDTTKQ